MRETPVDFGKARWIWTADNRTADQKLICRKHFCLHTVPSAAPLLLACDTKFWLWVNGTPVVYEGGVFRESRPGCGYAEQVDIAPYLQKGDNVIALLVWFYGNGGRNNTNSGEAGLIFTCPAVQVYSDAACRVGLHPAYQPAGEPLPSYLYGGHNIGFCATEDCGDFTALAFDDSAFETATEHENRAWGDASLSPLPLLRVYEVKPLPFAHTATGAVAPLPYAMTCSVGFVLEAEGGETVDIRTDRYAVNGGPGDEMHCYNGHRLAYVAKPGRNEYTCPMYLYGETVQFTFPETVTLRAVSYTESGYDTALLGSFRTEDPLFNRLIEKAIRTLYVCMRNNFMDCPDRERGQWIGDVSVQAPQVFFVCDSKAKKLLKKAICDFIRLRKGDVLVGNVPGEHASELPSQSLVAISDFGLIGEYYRYTQDREVLEEAFEPMVRYLQLWETDESGRLIPRFGNWYWFDHLYNVDEAVLEHGLYLAAARFARKVADILGRHEWDSFLNDRIAKTETCMESFWQGDRYASGAWVDERANAVAVLCGACPPERYPAVRKILLSVSHATPYMERFVLKALCEMGYVADAYRRMMSRYYNLATNENSTLWEDFYILGTRNHAWSGAPLEIAFRYILGLTMDDSKGYTLSPVSGIFQEITATFPLGDETVTVRFKEENGTMKEEP